MFFESDHGNQSGVLLSALPPSVHTFLTMDGGMGGLQPASFVDPSYILHTGEKDATHASKHSEKNCLVDVKQTYHIRAFEFELLLAIQSSQCSSSIYPINSYTGQSIVLRPACHQ